MDQSVSSLRNQAKLAAFDVKFRLLISVSKNGSRLEYLFNILTPLNKAEPFQDSQNQC